MFFNGNVVKNMLPLAQTYMIGIDMETNCLVKLNPNGSIINLEGSILTLTDEKDNDYSISFSDRIVLVNSSTSPINITLPLIPNDGENHTIKDSGGNAQNNPITINGNGRYIDGDTEFNLTLNYSSIEIVYSLHIDKWLIL